MCEKEIQEVVSLENSGWLAAVSGVVAGWVSGGFGFARFLVAGFLCRGSVVPDVEAMIVAAILFDAAIADNTLHKVRRFVSKGVEEVHVAFLSSVRVDEGLFLGNGLAITDVSLADVCPTYGN